jgi:hypothetical protein
MYYIKIAFKFYTDCKIGGFSPGMPASSTTKTGRHDIAEILLKVELSTKKNQISKIFAVTFCCRFNFYLIFSTMIFGTELRFRSIFWILAIPFSKQEC